jgi:peptidylprolyl isomerase
MKEFLRRFFIVFIVVLFVVTGLGVGLVGFWQALHPPKDTASQQAATQNPSGCVLGSEANVEKLAVPEVYKPEAKAETLQTTDLQEGTGPAAKAGDCLVMKYLGSLAADGKVFDGNYDKTEGLKFQLGKGQVIPGWDQGLIGMKQGGTRRLVIPSALGYGAQGSGSTIPPNSDLVFVVKLESVK